MSNRDLMSPTRALQQAISSLNRQLEQIAKRIRWSSSTATDSDDSAQTVTVDDSNFLPPYTLTTLASFTLDPGRWVILGSTSILIDGTNGDSWRSSLLISQDATTLDQARQQGFSNNAIEVQSPLAVSATVTLSAATTIDLDCYVATPDNEGTADAYRSRMTAVPA